MHNIKTFLQKRIVLGFTIFYTIVFLIVNIAFITINIRFINQTIDYQNEALVEMMEHLIEESGEETALIFLEHYGHTHQVYLEYIGLLTQTTQTTHIPPSNAKEYTINYNEAPFATLSIDHMASSITSINTTYFITFNTIFIVIFILGLLLLHVYVKNQTKVIIADFDNIKKRIHTLTFYNQYNFQELLEIDETFTQTLDTIDKIKDQHHQKIQTLTHDIKTPLTIIKSIVEGIESKRIELDQGILHSIKEEINHIDSLIPKIIEQYPEEVTKEQSISQVIQSQLASIKPLFDQKHIKINASIAPNVYFNCQKQDIKRLIDHLLSNVYHYAKNATQVDINLSENPLQIQVKENGEGFSEEALNHINRNIPHSSKKGTGLGLLMVKNIVEKYHGQITIKSSSKGSIITITFPS
jgi:signal transduction histidine kinase